MGRTTGRGWPPKITPTWPQKVFHSGHNSTSVSEAQRQRWAPCWHFLRQSQAMTYLRFSLHLLRVQSEAARGGSLEQPPAAGSWRLPITKAFIAECGWEKTTFPSCSYGMRDPDTGLPWRKRQCILSSSSMAVLASRRCACTSHSTIQGHVRGGEFRGKRKTALSGAYPTQMCELMAARIGEVCRGAADKHQWPAHCTMDTGLATSEVACRGAQGTCSAPSQAQSLPAGPVH